VIKYRIVMLPDRDIPPDDHEPVLEALDELLPHSLDRDAWQWSQAFYLPSCPAESEGDAFFVRNEGAPLPVDEFVRRGREIIAARAVQEPAAGLVSNLPPKTSPPQETPENIERVKGMLSAIPPDIGRKEWRQMGIPFTPAGLGDTIKRWRMSGAPSQESITPGRSRKWTNGFVAMPVAGSTSSGCVGRKGSSARNAVWEESRG
jgi:hypothetical protein